MRNYIIQICINLLSTNLFISNWNINNNNKKVKNYITIVLCNANNVIL